MRRPRAVWCCRSLLLVVASILAVPHPAAAGDGWATISAMRYFAGDAVDFGSKVYRSGPAFLVVPSNGEQAYVLDVRAGSVASTPRAAIAVGEDGSPTVALESLTTESLGSFDKRERGKWLVWTAGDAEMSVRPKPALIGAATADQVLEEKPKYRADADAYTPDADTIAEIAALDDGTSMVVAFGTWCPICAQWLPRFIKVLETLGDDAPPTTFLSVDQKVEEPADLLANHKINGVPTFVVRKSGHEIGRFGVDELEGNPDLSIESRILSILQQG